MRKITGYHVRVHFLQLTLLSNNPRCRDVDLDDEHYLLVRLLKISLWSWVKVDLRNEIRSLTAEKKRQGRPLNGFPQRFS